MHRNKVNGAPIINTDSTTSAAEQRPTSKRPLLSIQSVTRFTIYSPTRTNKLETRLHNKYRVPFAVHVNLCRENTVTVKVCGMGVDDTHR
jgi:hypothetical protein